MKILNTNKSKEFAIPFCGGLGGFLLDDEQKLLRTFEVDFSVEKESFPVPPSGIDFYQLNVYPCNAGRAIIRQAHDKVLFKRKRWSYYVKPARLSFNEGGTSEDKC
jgi:hypothetical protein